MFVFPKPASFKISYFVTAVHSIITWIEENGFDPFIIVDSTVAGVKLPSHLYSSKPVALKVAARSIARLEIADTHVAFNARFQGVDQRLHLPIESIVVIYAQGAGADCAWEMGMLRAAASTQMVPEPEVAGIEPPVQVEASQAMIDNLLETPSADGQGQQTPTLESKPSNVRHVQFGQPKKK